MRQLNLDVLYNIPTLVYWNFVQSSLEINEIWLQRNVFNANLCLLHQIDTCNLEICTLFKFRKKQMKLIFLPYCVVIDKQPFLYILTPTLYLNEIRN